jgi:hypothetical protein
MQLIVIDVVSGCCKKTDAQTNTDTYGSGTWKMSRAACIALAALLHTDAMAALS